MRHLKFKIVGYGVEQGVFVNAVFVPGSQTLNVHRTPVAGLDMRSWTDFAQGWGYDSWTDRTVMDFVDRIYGAFRSIPVYHNGVSPLPVF